MNLPLAALLALAVVVSGFPALSAAEGSRTVYGQAPAPAPPTDSTAPGIPGVIAAGAKVQLLASGLQGTEGPIAAPDGTFLFTEQNANRITRIGADGRVTPYLSNSNGTLGLAYDARGRLIAAQGTNPQIAVLSPTRDVLADSFDGMPLLRPNDLVVDGRGGIYFTDPGPIPQPGQTLNLPRKPAVLYIRPEGGVIRIAEDIVIPNGLVLSPDGRILYVADSRAETLLAFDVQPDGTVKNRRIFGLLQGLEKSPDGFRGSADGITVDSEGRVYAATRAGVQVISPQGRHLGTIPIGVAAGPQNLAFVGPDRKTLFIVGRGAAWKVPVLSQGVAGRSK